jgi:hypothetical protein
MTIVTQFPGCFVYVAVQVVKDKTGKDILTANLSALAYAVEMTSPVVSVYHSADDILLPKGVTRPFAFVFSYVMDALGKQYQWPDNGPGCVAVCKSPNTPVFGDPLPKGFTKPKLAGGEVSFIDTNDDHAAYNYLVRLLKIGTTNEYIVLDPRIENSAPPLP